MRAHEHLPETFNAAWHFVGRHVAEGRGERTALVTDAGALSYAQLDEDVRRFAAAARAAGVHRDDRVALILPDGPLLSAGFWGAIAAGAVAVPINTLLRPADHAAILADCDPRLVVVQDAGAPPGEDRTVWSAAEATQRLAAATPLPGYARTHRDGFAFFLYSSGTTGEPKGVVHLQHDMWVCARSYGAQVLGVRPDDRCFSVAKLFFAYGLGNAQYFPFDVGASAVLYAGRPAPEAVFEQVRRHRPTLFFGVPTAYAQMLAVLDAGAAADFSSVRLCVSAGEALPAALFERWRQRTGVEILDGIGSTEICHIFLSNRAGAVRPGSSGTPVPGYDLRVVDDTGADAPHDEIGDLLVRGDSTMALYWNQHEATKRTLVGDWIRTGDKYHVDAEGTYWHAGRSDDMLKVGGIWVSPVEVESALIAHPKVLECAVVGHADAEGLTKAHAVVVLRPGVSREGAAEELTAFARERLAHHKCPRSIVFVDELPKTATGKIRRFVLRSLVAP
jgi:benzoate-CoA ligase family protein